MLNISYFISIIKLDGDSLQRDILSYIVDTSESMGSPFKVVYLVF